MSRRAYILWIDPGYIMNLMGNWRQCDYIKLPHLAECVDAEGRLVRLPEDYRVDDATYDWERRAIGLRLTHKSFPETPPGERLPCLHFNRAITITGMRIVQEGDDMHPIIVEHRRSQEE